MIPFYPMKSLTRVAEVSVHSRAARRAASPPPKTKGGAVAETEYKPWLHSVQNGGIAKKKTKQLTRQQKLRQQRGVEKADVTNAKLEKKVEDSKGRARRVQARRADWEALNEEAAGKSVKGAKQAGHRTREEIVPLDEAMSEAATQHDGGNRAIAPHSLGQKNQAVGLEHVEAATPSEEVDEIT